jgi:hypothetical protein
MEPLLDLHGRTLCIGSAFSLDAAVEAILRMQNARNWKDPISVYLGIGAADRRMLTSCEAITLCGIISLVRSPVHTFGVGALLMGWESLVLAAGCPGHRYLLPHTLLSIAPVDSGNLPLPNGQIGWSGKQEFSLRAQATAALNSEISRLVVRLGLPPELWETPKILSARDAVHLRLADSLISSITPKPPSHELRQH